VSLMKKAIGILMYLLIALTVLYPAGVIITSFFGYRFELISVSAFAIVLAVLSACILVLDFNCKDTPVNNILRILLAIITPISLINAVFYILACPQIWVIAGILFSTVCCCYLTLKYGKPLVPKIIALGLSALMIMPIGYLSFFALVLGNFGQTTVVQTVVSPSGKYYAQVINSDQGALGGSTYVDVCQNLVINALIFKIEKKPRTVYVGDWFEYKNIQIYWENDNRLVVNSFVYQIE